MFWFGKHKMWPLTLHAVLLALFALGMVALWLLPVITAGYPFIVSGLISSARTFAATGIVPPDSAHMSVLLLRYGYAFIGGTQLLCYTVVNALVFGLALLPWWFAVRKIFNVRVAWISTIILALLPMYWLIAVRLDGYAFALFFLFLGFAAFTHLYPRHRIAAVILMGLCIGAALAARDALLTLLPWFVGGYLWHEHRRFLRACAEAALFCLLAYVAFVLPLLPNALQSDLPTNERIAMFLPSLEHRVPGTGHLYPDDYAYEFLREVFNERIAERAADASFIERQEDENYRAIFGVGSVSTIDMFINGAWLTVNALPDYFFLDTVGGVFLWLFVIPGVLILRRKRPELLFHILGLWVSMEFLLRFALHFHRSHAMDIAWAITLLAAVGVSGIATVVRKRQGTLVLLSVTAVIALQLLQANRKQFAELYRRSSTPEVLAATMALEATPADAVIAHPRRGDLLTLVDRTNVALHPETLEVLADEQKLADPFRHYGVTHIIGYDEEQAQAIKRDVPGIIEIQIPEERIEPPRSPLIKYLLHQIR